MHQFFVEKSQVGKEYVTITGSDVNHIRNVLRMKIGETIRISDREGGNYFCKIAETGKFRAGRHSICGRRRNRASV